MSNSINIRPVEKNDLPRILHLCTLHAAYEKLPFELNGQVSRLSVDLFAKEPRLYCLVAENEGEVIAYATYMKQYATWEATDYLYLDCLFVLESYRSQRIGERLMDKVKQSAARLGCGHIQWQTPTFNEGAIKFYNRIGAHSKPKERFFLAIQI